MNLTNLQRHWDAFGRPDPMWAILTDPARKGGRWTADEFFATGVAEIGALMAEARTLGLPAHRQRALDAPALPTGALPAGSYRAAITVRSQAITVGAAGAAMEVDVQLTNTSDQTWPAGVPLNLGRSGRPDHRPGPSLINFGAV